MSHSLKVALAGFLMAVIGNLEGDENLRIGAFIIFGAACVCRSIEDLKGRNL